MHIQYLFHKNLVEEIDAVFSCAAEVLWKGETTEISLKASLYEE